MPLNVVIDSFVLGLMVIFFFSILLGAIGLILQLRQDEETAKSLEKMVHDIKDHLPSVQDLRLETHNSGKDVSFLLDMTTTATSEVEHYRLRQQACERVMSYYPQARSVYVSLSPWGGV